MERSTPGRLTPEVLIFIVVGCVLVFVFRRIWGPTPVWFDFAFIGTGILIGDMTGRARRRNAR